MRNPWVDPVLGSTWEPLQQGVGYPMPPAPIKLKL